MFEVEKLKRYFLV